MSAALKSYPESVRLAVAHRRDKAGSGGLGYWAARDAIKKYEKQPKEKPANA